MLRRHPWLVRAHSAAGLFACFLLAGAVFAGEPADPLPGADSVAQPVDVLQAQRDGDLDVIVRGHGASSVTFKLKNTSSKRLRVVIPPGLVASSAMGQPGGGGGAGGGFQSMGLGVPTANAGSFGQFRSQSEAAGFRSVPTTKLESQPEGILLSPGQALDLPVPSVCLNFGVPTPTPRNVFKLETVEDYTPDVRARKALKSAAILGTSQGVAQAAMWHVFNGMSFEQIATQARKYVNLQEVNLAARYVQALDASASSDIIDPAYFSQGRILVRLRGHERLAKEVSRLTDELESTQICGLPVRIADEMPDPAGVPASLYLDIALTGTTPKSTTGRVTVYASSVIEGWRPLGNSALKLATLAPEASAEDLADAVGRTLAASFVTIRPSRHTPGMTTFRVDNRLPFTLAAVQVRTGRSEAAGSVTLDRIGLGPQRSTYARIPAATGVVEGVVLNGL